MWKHRSVTKWNGIGADQPFPDFINMNQICSIHCLVAWVTVVNLGWTHDFRYDSVYETGLQVLLLGR